jgi:beta-lactam-binding protein with PASTA domain
MSRGAVEAPDVLGLTFASAVSIGGAAGLLVVGHAPDGAPVALDSEGIVVEQEPQPSARCRVGQVLSLRVGRGDGGAKDPEPRRPEPLVRNEFGQIGDSDDDLDLVPA